MCLLGSVCWIGGHALYGWARTPLRNKASAISVEIPLGADLKTVTESLFKNRIIEHPDLFYHWVRWVMDAGDDLKWGQLEFRGDMTPLEVLRVLRKGTPVIHWLNIPPGLRLEQVAAVLEDSDLAIRGDLLQIATDEQFVKSLGIKSSSLEGYLAPGNYGLARHLNAETVLKLMVARRYANWSIERRKRAQALRTNLHKVLTLASIIEAETTIDGEREKIAAVFYNRIIHDWKLCSDATAAYAEKIAKGRFDGLVDDDDRTRENPYNTWVNRGLPPGPICSPSQASINAALWPPSTSAMYFVPMVGRDKGHRFCPDLLCALGRSAKK